MIEELLHSFLGFFERDAFSVAVDVFDIGFVATLVYGGLSLIKGTRGMQMSIGLVLVFMLHQLAQRFGLITMWTLLDALLTYSVLIVVVIFQSDIRRALMRVGQRPFLRGRPGGRETHVIEEVIKAASALAQRRMGALIVFERNAVLDEFIEKGTEIDAAMSNELLYGIFIPSFENPMHDGAVIVREGRVWQAGAFLPLSVSPKLDRTVGARHRAAIGISEETDAVVVVVSEERGAISLVFGGNIIRNLDTPSLREALHGLFYKGTREKNGKRIQTAQPPSEVSERVSSDSIHEVSLVNEGAQDQGSSQKTGTDPSSERVLRRNMNDRDKSSKDKEPGSALPATIATRAVKKAEEKSG
ncbi:MAG: diadenylate cyclase CdaA [Myxococcota bacterium]